MRVAMSRGVWRGSTSWARRRGGVSNGVRCHPSSRSVDTSFDEQGFAGNQSEYYDPRNSLLNHVLDRRTGIPITLSVVYIEVGRRAGLRVEGVGLPGHFIVRVGDDDGAALVDPFHGTTIDEDDCQQRLDIVYGGQVPLTDEHLRATSTHEILVRLLRNLKAIYTQSQLYARALAVVERILLLAPHALDERRDRGLLLAQLGRFSPAIADLQTYLGFVPNAARRRHRARAVEQVSGAVGDAELIAIPEARVELRLPRNRQPLLTAFGCRLLNC